MKQRLEQLTLSQFIELACGDMSVLLGNHEAGNNDKMMIAMRNIVLEYRSIADPGGTNSYLKSIETWIKAKMKVLLFTMCDTIVKLGRYEKVREVLSEYGLPASSWNESRIKGIVQAKLSQAQRELKEIDAENEKLDKDRDRIRFEFDEQIALIMAHFKFQIDPTTIKASLYAHLVKRYNREVKAQIAALNKK